VQPSPVHIRQSCLLLQHTQPGQSCDIGVVIGTRSVTSALVSASTKGLVRAHPHARYPHCFFNLTSGRVIFWFSTGMALALSMGYFTSLVAIHIAATRGDLEGVSFSASLHGKGHDIRIEHLFALAVTFLLSAAVSSMYDASSMEPGTTASCTWFVQQIRRIRFLHIGVCVSAFAMLFGVPTLINFLKSETDVPTMVVVLVPLIMAKFLLVVLRSMARVDGKLLNILVVIAFSLNVMTSQAIRIQVMLFLDTDFLKLFVVCLAVSGVEFVARTSMGLSHLLRTGYAYQQARINGLTLDSLVRLAASCQHRADLHYGQLWIDQFSEVFVIVMIVLQQLTQPVWAMYLTWDSYAAYESRHGSVLIGALIQLGVELLVDSSVLGLCYRCIPIDTLATFRRLRSKSLVRPFFLSPAFANV